MERGSFTRQLLEVALDPTLGRPPQAVVDRAKQLFLDFLAVAFGGAAHAPAAAALRRAVRRLLGGVGGPCSVVACPDGCPAPHAALINAACAHSMDYDDTHREAILHIGAPVFAAALAVAEQRRASGARFLEGVIAGYEVAGRLGRAFGEAIHRVGFHPTATTGIFGATAAAARLAGLDRQALHHAWGINLSQASGSQQFLQDGSWNKPLHPGLAAQHAVVAVHLAEEGFRGAQEVFEGRWGYAALYAGGRWQPERALERPAGAPAYEVMATAVKPYPCCRYLHPVIDGVLELVERHGISPDTVSEVQVALPEVAVGLVAEPVAVKRRPTGVVEGQFSVYFAAAVALVDGQFRWESYRRLGDAVLWPLMDRVQVRGDPGLGSMQAEVALTTCSGTVCTRVTVPGRAGAVSQLGTDPGEAGGDGRAAGRCGGGAPPGRYRARPGAGGGHGGGGQAAAGGPGWLTPASPPRGGSAGERPLQPAAGRVRGGRRAGATAPADGP